MPDDSNPLDEFDLDRSYANYLRTCAMTGVEPVSRGARGRVDQRMNLSAIGAPGTADALAPVKRSAASSGAHLTYGRIGA